MTESPAMDAAIDEVLKREAEFSALMPPDWEADPLHHAISDLRAAYEAAKPVAVGGEMVEWIENLPRAPTPALRAAYEEYKKLTGLASLEAARSAEAVAETRAKLIEILDAESIKVTDRQADLIVAYFAHPTPEASDV